MVHHSHGHSPRCIQRKRFTSLACFVQILPYSLGFAVGVQPSMIMPRNSITCPADNLLACPSSIPFCCPKGTVCTSLTPENNSVICCPRGNNCSIIATVSCDISLQDPEEHPGALLQTNRLDGKLTRCGDGCCPFGYTCDNGNCVQSNQSPSATSSSPEASASHSSSPTSTSPSNSTPIPTKTMHPIIIPTVTAVPSTSDYPAKAVILGLCMGFLGGILVGLLIWFFCIRKRRRHTPQHHSGSQSRSHTRDGSDIGATKPPSYVSEPVIASEYGGGHRTDFLLRTPERQTSLKKSRLTPSPLRIGLPINPTAAPPQRPPRSDEDSNQYTGQPGAEYIELDAATKQPQPQQPQTEATRPGVERHPSDGSYISTGSSSGRNSRGERTGSGETINVLMPPPVMAEGGPNWRGVSTNTTFSAMMERAGMKRGPGFAEYPGRWSFGQR